MYKPFDKNIDKQKRFNISNAQAAKTDIEEFLLSIETISITYE